MTNLKSLAVATLLCASTNVFASNTKTTVNQVTNSVTLSSDVDYLITSTTPFTTSGSVNITNTNHAVVIIQNIKPSVVISDWLDHIYINGTKAEDGTNCQVKMYSHGAIILPYSSDIQPLTCYTQPNFTGTSCSNYSEGHDGGFMKTLDSSTLNNQIRSFKLKRGYMVTFALGTGGWGYSRCFIADQADLEISSMPTNMDGRISSYRIFKWQNAKKAGLASNTSFDANDALNSSWCYSWGTGENRYPDTECVPNHIYEDWPSASACGSVDYSCHMKTNNEPGNSSDDHPQDVATVLNNWQNLMRTGMRLCSESSHDGSMSHLKSFIDSIDARGWRCDLLDLHCYWAASTFNSLTWYSNYYGNGRPIWISEWVWGASWNKNGIFSAAPDGASSFSEDNQQTCYDGTKPILDILNSNTRVERYAYWNSEADASKIYKDGTLSILGEYYANMDDDLGYLESNEFVPTVVCLSPTDLTATYSSVNGTCELEWNDPNGDMLDSIVIEAKVPGKVNFKRLTSITPKDMNAKAGASYAYTTTINEEGTYSYRIAVYPIGSTSPVRSGSVTIVTPNGDSFEDVTDQYITNAGFDTSSDYVTSNLSTGEDNHLAITGWTTTNTTSFGCSGAFAFGSQYTINGTTVPTTNVNGETGDGMLAFSQGWSTQAVYTQQVTLPAGTYRYSYNVYNAKNTTSITNYTGVIIDNTEYYGSLTNIPEGKWRTESIEFSLSESTTVTLSVGYSGPSATSTNSPFLCFDNVKLEQDKAYLDSVDDDYNYLVHWDGDGETGSGSEANNFGWSSNISRTWGVANGTGTRYEDYNVSGGYTGYTTTDGTTWTDRLLWIRFGNNETYTFDMSKSLSSGQTYRFSGLVGWNSNGDSGSTITINIYCGSTIYATTTAVTTTAKKLYSVEAVFSVPESETMTDWYLTVNNSCNNKDQIIALTDLSLVCSSATTNDVSVIDYSSSITNAGYDSNTNDGWSGTSTTAVSYTCAEHYNKTFDYYQTITGLPAGTYRVGVQAFYRAGYASNDYSTKDDSSYDYAQLYATGNGTTNTVALKRASSEASSTNLGGSESTVGSSLYIPNNMQAASLYFAADKYHNYIYATVGTDGTLTIGLKNTTTISGDWTIFDNWTLEYYEENGETDYSSYITNASYDSNTNDGWSGTGTTAVSYTCAEHYNKTYDYYQTITGLPAGTYTVGVQAFYRAGYASNDYSTKDNSSYDYAKLYATGNGTTNNVAIKRASSEASSTNLGGSESSVGSGLYIPNNMQAASLYFAADKYHNSIQATVGSDGTLTIGLKKTTTISGDWTIFDNWTLTYNGDNSSEVRDRTDETTEITSINTSDTPIQFFTLEGKAISTPKSGINIIRMNDGSVRKIWVK